MDCNYNRQAQRHQAETDFAAARQKLIDAAGDALDGDQVKPEYRQLPLYGLPAIKHRWMNTMRSKQFAMKQPSPPIWKPKPTTTSIVSSPATTTTATSSRSGATAAENKYAIPYNGEEVTLYWANFDQYYVKTGEYFTDYRFAIEPSIGFERATVHFKLRAASVEQNNVKGEKRFFLLATPEPVTWDAEGRILTVGFEYRPLTDGEKLRYGAPRSAGQAAGRGDPAILKATPDPLLRDRLAERAASRARRNRCWPANLTRYAARNTRDYFIHKDLSAFLTSELDFFLKNEVLRLEDLDFDRPATMQPVATPAENHPPDRGPDHRLPGADRRFSAPAVGEAQVRGAERLLRDARPRATGAVPGDRGQRPPAGRMAEALRPGGGAGRRSDRASLRDGGYRLLRRRFQGAGLLASFADLDAACDGLLVHGRELSGAILTLASIPQQCQTGLH